MQEEVALAVAAVVVVGVAAQWIADRLRLPSILLLLFGGILIGPVLGIIHPDEQFQPLLFPLVSVGVGLLLFEGGLGLNLRRLETGRSTVLRLVTIGAFITWIVGFIAVDLFLDVERGQALLLGAVLVVSGPTVVIPLLEQARPRPRVAAVLRWEAILIDPIGAALAVVILEGLLGGGETSPLGLATEIALKAVIGIGMGVAMAAALLFAVHRHWISDRLQVPVVVGGVVLVMTLASRLQPEAGLFATTAMGLTMANQRRVAVGHIAEFGEHLGPLILAGLFVTLGALIDPNTLGTVWLPAIGVLAVLLLLARPLAVLAGTLGSDLSARERTYLGFIAPRGVVAAAVASLFALDLTERGAPFPELVPMTVIVILGSVLVSGLGARPLAHRLHVDEIEPRGLALVGAHPWILDIAQILIDRDLPVLVIDPEHDAENTGAAASRGFLVFQGRLDSEELRDSLRAVGVAQVLLASRSEEVNVYGVGRFTQLLGRANVFHLPPTAAGDGDEQAIATAKTATGRQPFGNGYTQEAIGERVATSPIRVCHRSELRGGDVALVVLTGDKAVIATDLGAVPDTTDVIAIRSS